MSSRMHSVARRIIVGLVALSLTVLVAPMASAATATSASRVAAGEDHTCFITTAGAAKCWGANGYGQLGNGVATQFENQPVNVKGLASGVAAIVAGGRHTCALLTSGGVKCWGQGVNGELGDGTGAGSLTPVNVTGLASDVVAITAHYYHSCALTSGGAVKCWGDNLFGNLGGGSGRQLIPVDVVGLSSGVVAIAAGNAHTCALTGLGGVKCWGGSGVLGNGGSGTQNASPVDVVGLSGVVAIAAGNAHTCALTSGGGVKCWGANGNGQLGNGTLSSFFITTAADVVGLGSGVAAIAAGGNHNCALATGGGVNCWGDNAAGDLGNGSSTQVPATSPVAVSGLGSGVVGIAAGGTHSCALLGSGGVKCWGSNAYGQLGNAFANGYRAYSAIPVNVVGLAVVQTIALKPSKAAGTIARKTIVTFTATIKPLEPVGSHATARFEIYHKVSGSWRLTTRRDVIVGATGKATLRWTFSTAGSWYVRARALVNTNYAASAWSTKVSYTVR